MSMWLMWFVVSLDKISAALLTISVIAAVISLFVMIVICVNDDGYKSTEEHDRAIKEAWKLFKPILISSVFLFIGFLLIPTTKQMAAIYFVPKVLNNQQIQKMPNKLVTLANDWMDEQIKDLKGK